MSKQIEFIDEVPAKPLASWRLSAYEIDAIVAQLKEKPGQWAKVRQHTSLPAARQCRDTWRARGCDVTCCAFPKTNGQPGWESWMVARWPLNDGK